uniref:Alternative protein NID1 n=1 Tax=Homo sapiens TaxID=9606 RepID=L8EC96_HUMAN|nr:alternative protein NID1 [Homo sapiens]
MPEPQSAQQTQGSRRAPVSFCCDELREESVFHRLEDEFRGCSRSCNFQGDGCFPTPQADPAVWHHHGPVSVSARP